jgi:hypothetical protein
MADQVKSNIFKEKGKILIPILLFIVFQSAFNAFSPILNRMSEMFPDTPTMIIQMATAIFQLQI